MCGRFTLTNPEELVGHCATVGIGVEATDLKRARYNVAPGQAVIALDRSLKLCRPCWGLTTPVQLGAAGRLLINARVESLQVRPAFRHLRDARCLIFADGFYEWKRLAPGAARQPYYVRCADGRLIGLAGLLSTQRDTNGSCVIITQDAAGTVRTIHDRMPVIIAAQHYRDWLQQPHADAAQIKRWTLSAAKLEAYPVSRQVNATNNDHPGCLQRVAEPSQQMGLFNT